jgi:hypothetical protein
LREKRWRRKRTVGGNTIDKRQSGQYEKRKVRMKKRGGENESRRKLEQVEELSSWSGGDRNEKKEFDNCCVPGEGYVCFRHGESLESPQPTSLSSCLGKSTTIGNTTLPR